MDWAKASGRASKLQWSPFRIEGETSVLGVAVEHMDAASMEPLPNRRGNGLVVTSTPQHKKASMEPLPNRRGNRKPRRLLAPADPRFNGAPSEWKGKPPAQTMRPVAVTVLQWSPFRIEGETVPVAAGVDAILILGGEFPRAELLHETGGKTGQSL